MPTSRVSSASSNSIPPGPVGAEQHPESEERDQHGQPGACGAERDHDARGEDCADDGEARHLRPRAIFAAASPRGLSIRCRSARDRARRPGEVRATATLTGSPGRPRALRMRRGAVDLTRLCVRSAWICLVRSATCSVSSLSCRVRSVFDWGSSSSLSPSSSSRGGCGPSRFAPSGACRALPGASARAGSAAPLSGRACSSTDGAGDRVLGRRKAASTVRPWRGSNCWTTASSSGARASGGCSRSSGRFPSGTRRSRRSRSGWTRCRGWFAWKVGYNPGFGSRRAGMFWWRGRKWFMDVSDPARTLVVRVKPGGAGGYGAIAVTVDNPELLAAELRSRAGL